MTPRERHVSELVLVFGEPAADVVALLRDRPSLASSDIAEIPTAWGRVWVQHTFPVRPDEQGTPPHRVLVGRPTVRSAVVADPPRPGAWLEARGGIASRPTEASEALSGMFAAFEFDDQSVRILTDRMGFRPVYVARDDSGKVRSIGTHAETVASASGTGSRIDPVSVAELLVHNDITFPYTTRETMRELPPASLTTIPASTREPASETLWEPTEPARFPPATQMRARIAEAMRESARDLTRGCDRVGVLLSGGADSRAVLGAVRDGAPKGTRVDALTYVTRENNETRVAGKIAAAAGSTHVLVRRGEDYFPKMLGRGLSLLGCELRGNCHGLGIADQGIAADYDAVIGGQLSDTLLKDHFMSMRCRHEHRSPTFKQAVRSLIPGLRRPPPESSPEHTTGRDLLEPMVLTEAMRQSVRARRDARLEAVRCVRPSTAEMWRRFWPCSRQDDSAHTLGNTRIMRSDTLYAHSAVVEVASDLSYDARVDGVPANGAIIDVSGPLGAIENANTGLPIDATPAQLRQARKARRAARALEPQSAPNDAAPWNAVESSWVDPKIMQKQSPEWIEARARLAGSPALGFLDGIAERGGKALIGSYQGDLPSNTNHIAMQIAVWLDAALPSDR